jgi:hypothetical protein
MWARQILKKAADLAPADDTHQSFINRFVNRYGHPALHNCLLNAYMHYGYMQRLRQKGQRIGLQWTQSQPTSPSRTPFVE